jgi:hypothetical protein
MELRRALKPGGVLRLALPDLGKGIQAYMHGHNDYIQVDNTEVKSRGGRFIVHMLWYGSSQSLFTVDFIEELLLKAGFAEVVPCGYRNTASGFQEIIDLDNRECESLYVEATKPVGTRGDGLSTQARHMYNPDMARKVSTEVVEVSAAERSPQHLRGNLDVPKPGDRMNTTSLGFSGWAVGQNSRAETVEILDGRNVVGLAPVEIHRPDVVRVLGLSPEADAAGFRVVLTAQGTGESELLIRVALEDGTRFPLAAVRIKISRQGRLRSLSR